MRTWIKKLFVGNPAITSSVEFAESELHAMLASEHKEQGDAHLQNGEFAAAAQAYRHAIDANRQFASAYCRLGYALKELQQLDEAQTALIEAITIDPTMADAHYLLAAIAVTNGNTDAASKHFKATFDLAPDFELAYLDFCIYLFQIAEYDEAIRVGQVGLLRFPDSANMLFFLGNSYHANKLFDLAIPAFEKALSFQPNRSDILSNLSHSLLARGDIEKAIPVLRQVVASHPSDINLQNNLGSALQENGHLEEAIAIFERALAIAPEDLFTLWNTSRALQAAGKLDRAVLHYEKALTISPDHAQSHQNLGDTLKALGQYEKAIKHYRFALALEPHSADMHFRIGFALAAANDVEGALASYRNAVSANPDFTEAYQCAGNALQELKRTDEAVTSYRHALRIKPNFLDAHQNLGAALQSQKNFEEAMCCYRKVIEINPLYTAAHQNLGSVMRELGRIDEAIECYRGALALDPQLVETRLGLGIALMAGRKFNDAISAFHEALGIAPAHTDTLNNLGCLLFEVGRASEAEVIFRRRLQIEPENADTHYNLGNALTNMQYFEDAIACFRKAIRIKPTYTGAYANLANVLADVGLFEDAMETYRQAMQSGDQHFWIHSNLLFVRNYMPDLASATLVGEAAHYGELMTKQAQPYTEWPNTTQPDRRLRIGLVSGDFRQHPVGFFVDSTLAALASDTGSRLELIAYNNYDYSDYLTEHIKAHCHAWRLIAGLSDETVAKQIRADDIDILLDLSGHSSMNRLPLMAWKPAPVQASWLGYFATTGVKAIDYFIADPWSIPSGNEAQFTEKIWRLPETRFSFTPPNIDISVSTLPALQNGYVTFGCFNNLSKMTDQVVALWARIMCVVPESRLFLKSIQLGGDKVRDDVIAKFGRHGITKHRLIMEGFTSRADYLAAYHRVDIALDPFPYTGGATTAESLWMGVPVFSLTGERLIARQGTSLLMNAGLPDWVASSEDDYLSGVLHHARDLQRLAALRAGLRAQVLASPLFDATRLAQHLETALRNMWAQWCDQQSSVPN